MQLRAQSILCGIFFVSGAAGLLFQTLWFRQAGLAFGNSVVASSIVLASFMAGLAIGNGAMARYGSRVPKPLYIYAGLEVAIALTGIALVWTLPQLAAAVTPWVQPVLDNTFALNGLRVAFAFFLLVVPASAMGATLPLLIKAVDGDGSRFGSVLGRLYGWNTLGAVVGALIGELALIGWVGIRGTALVAGGLNLFAAIAILHPARQAGAAPGVSAADNKNARPPMGARAARLLGAAFLSGFLLLALEVVWFRFLGLFVHAGSVTFAIMLAVVLVGIGVGGCMGGVLVRRSDAAVGMSSWIALASGALVLLLYQAFALVLTPDHSVYVGSVRIVLLLTTILTLPVALLSGVLFPLIGAGLARHLAPAERAAGLLTLANTIGACMGSLIGGFVLLPALGMELSFFLLGAGYCGVAVLTLGLRQPVDASSAEPVRSPVAAWAPAGLFALVVALFPFGMMQDHYFVRVAERFGYPEHAAVVGIREGTSESIVYLEDRFMGLPVSHQMVTGGFSMAGNSVFYRRYMKLFVYWPVAVHPNPKSALLISYGVGSTAEALIDTEALASIDIVDISRDVLEMNTIAFPGPGGRPIDDPRVRVHIEDGRYYLGSRRDRFDIITAEPPPPKHAGIVNLYTREYFELMRERLAEGGIATYWLPVHLLSTSDSKAIIRAYCDVFEDCSLWGGGGYNWMLIGSRDAKPARDPARFAAQWRDPKVRDELIALGLERPELLGTLFLFDAEQLSAMTADTLPLVDDHPHRLSTAMIDRGEQTPVYSEWMDTRATAERFAASRYVRETWPATLRDATLREFEAQALIDATIPIRGAERPQQGLGESIARLHELLEAHRLRTPALWHLGVDHDQLEAIERAIANGAPPQTYAQQLATRALVAGDFRRAAALFGQAQANDPRRQSLIFLRLYALCMAGDLSAAERIARSIPEPHRRNDFQSDYWRFLGETFGVGDAAPERLSRAN